MKKEGLFRIGSKTIRAGQYTAICSLALNALSNTYLHIASVDYLTGECILVQDTEGFVSQMDRVYDWMELRSAMLGLIEDEDLEKFKTCTTLGYFRRVAEQGMESDSFTYRRKTEDHNAYMQTMIVPVRQKKLENCVFLYAKNLDEATRAEELHKEQLWTMMRQAQTEENRKEEYLKYFSQGLKVPVDAVIGMCGLAKEALEAGDTEKAAKFLRIAAGTGKCARMMLGDIVQLSIRQEQRFSTQKNRFSLRSLLEGYRVFYEKIRMWDQEVQFHMEIDDRLCEEYFGDDGRLIQMLNELLSNAYQYSRSGGEVMLNVSLAEHTEEKDFIEFVVSDNGIGISEEFAPYLFDFFSVGKHREFGARPGTGMGLSVVKMAVEALEGTIQVESKEDLGSKFRIVVPLYRADLRRRQGIVPGKVMVVDDNELNRNIVVEMLRMDGREADAFEDGCYALEAFEKSAPGTYGIVLTDLMMPQMDGYTLAERIRASAHPDGKTVRVIGLSACLDKERYQGTKAFNGYLLKPFRIEEFLELCEAPGGTE